MPTAYKALLFLVLASACEAPPVCDLTSGKCYHAPVVQYGTNHEDDNDFFFWFYLSFFLALAASNPGRRGRF